MRTVRELLNLFLVGLGCMVFYFLLACLDLTAHMDRFAIYIVGGLVVWSVSRTLYNINQQIEGLRAEVAMLAASQIPAPSVSDLPVLQGQSAMVDPQTQRMAESLDRLRRAMGPGHKIEVSR